ncbi:MAG: DNA polymerase I [Deltaproteobacteria bacterium HGW-Deltaproteobacteria-13]|jgi:DNA polymerase-1|nr:MAG: DNA polymerase I [Deltaproteobacteria bacterium HGW-Deltaproteobacteria-13]
MTEKNKTPLVALVDGSNYIYRAFYAIPHLTNSKGFPTNAIYGFTNMLMKLLRDLAPDYIVVTFDLRGPTTRHGEFEDYKATRKPMPDDLIPQIPFIKDVVRGFSICVLEKQGTEADDLIGTLALQASAKGWRTAIISGDKDLMQMIDDQVTMVDTMKDKTYDAAAVKEKFGVGPDKVVEILGLMGDTSDNIPGVPGIGPKTAQRLIEEYGSVDAVIENAENLRNVKLRESFRQYAGQARLSRQLALIRKDIEMDFDLRDAARKEPDKESLSKLFSEFEFSSLLQQIKTNTAKPVKECTVVANSGALSRMITKLHDCSKIACEMVWEKNPPPELIGMALSADDELFYLPLSHTNAGEQLPVKEALAALAPVLKNARIIKYVYDLKTALVNLANLEVHSGEDLQLAAYLLNPARHAYELDEIVWEYLHERIPAQNDVAGGKGKMYPLALVPVDKMAVCEGPRADAIFSLAPILEEQLKKTDANELYRKVEMPLLYVLADMEKKGVLVDTSLLKQMSTELGRLLSLSEEKIFRLAGEKFNINSPKQLQTILFEKLKLPAGKKTKEGYSTDVDVLTELARGHELPAEILAYRSLSKLKSTYVDALPALIHPQTGRIHTSYNQTVAATGRLSSSNPNLQNIPIRTLEGKRIRQAFIADPDCLLISADYSQIELRVLAHLSEDEALLEAFSSNEDIHSRTASDVFGVFPQMVNADMRRQAKVINFGILYGMSAFGLAKELGVSMKMAQEYIDGYFKRYKKVRVYLDGILEGARRDGFVSTLLNRRRYLPELKSKIPSVRQFAERMAINTPIQGTAADLIKVAMVNIDHLLTKTNLSARLIMQVHDELVVEAPQKEKEAVMRLVKKEMEEVIQLKVPLKVEIASGKNWDEAH